MSAATTSGRTPASPQGRHAPRHRIQWTDRLTRGDLEHMRVNHRRAYITVSQELLHRTDIGPTLQEMRRKAVPPCVRLDVASKFNADDPRRSDKTCKEIGTRQNLKNRR
jgi:hypothetical protein